jgi:hypothetical protein
MSGNPIEIAVTQPVMNSTFADVTVTATSFIIDNGYVFETVVGGGTPSDLGTITNVDKILYDPTVPVTHLNTDNGTLYLSSHGISILPGSSNPPPSVPDFDIALVAHSNPVDITAAQNVFFNSTFDSALHDNANIMITTDATTLTTENLSPGTDYYFSIHGFDPSTRYVNTVLVSGTTTVDPVIQEVSVTQKITSANVEVHVIDEDSSALLRIAVAPFIYNPSAVAIDLAAGTYTNHFFETTVSSGSNSVDAPFADLLPNTQYRVVVVALDSVTNNVITDTITSFVTYPRPIVAITSSSRTYTSVSATSTHTFLMDDVDVITAIVPNTTTDITQFMNNNADPLGNLEIVNYPNKGTYSLTLHSNASASNVSYAAVVKVVPALQPEEFVHETLPLRVAIPPTILINDVVEHFVYGGASFVVLDPDATVNVYAAIHADSPNSAIELLLSQGSTAYPNAQVAVASSNIVSHVSRNDLHPGTPYYVTVVAVETEDGSLITSSTTPFTTWATPTMTLELEHLTDTVLAVNVTSIGHTHDLFLHLTPNVVAGSVLYDSASIATIEESTPETVVVLANDSNVFSHAFSNLIEHTQYGVVVVIAQSSDNTVLDEATLITKTIALPDLLVSIESYDYQSVNFNVIGNDLDGAFRLLTAVTLSPFTNVDAEAFSDVGIDYLGSGIVNGTQTDFPNDVDAQHVDLSFSHSNLQQDTDFFAVAVAVDDASGIVQWAQQPFHTDLRPVAVITSVTTTTTSLSFDIECRDGPELVVFYNLFSANEIISVNNIVTDPEVKQETSYGVGPRTLSLVFNNLIPGTSYAVGCVALAPNGAMSVVSMVEAMTKRMLSLEFIVDDMRARSISTTVDFDITDAPLAHSAIALFPTGTIVDENLARGVIQSTASNMIQRNAAFNLSTALSYGVVFDQLSPGDRLVLVAAALQPDDNDNLVHAYSNILLRVEPHVAIVGDVFVSTTTVTSDAIMSFVDPDPMRANAADFMVSVVPSGDTDLSWLTTNATTNPVVPAAAVETLSNITTTIHSFRSCNLVEHPQVIDICVRCHSVNIEGAVW